MFLVLNRLRGMHSLLRPVMAFFIGLVAYLLTYSYLCSIITFGVAWAGISMGWGDWDLVATNRDSKKPSPYTEGDYNGIQWLAERLISSDKNWLNHARVCLLLMGMYRASFMIVISFWIGLPAITGFLLLSPMFLIASELGYYTSKIWNFKFMNLGWEHQEVIYGFGLDLIFIGEYIWMLQV